MKNLLIALVFVAGSTAMANEAKKAETTTAPAAAAAPATADAATKVVDVKAAALNKKAAKEACLTENAALKKDKKGLDACINGKMTAATPAPAEGTTK